MASQALKEGKRLVTVYWLNDIVVKKKVVPPWKAIHFPMPAKQVISNNLISFFRRRIIAMGIIN